MSTAVETHIDKALASLEDLSAKELEATADNLTRRPGDLREFGLAFRDALGEREGQSWSSAREHLESGHQPR